ncbi:unnamed protein product, partial [Rotaria sp. Silwood2]
MRIYADVLYHRHKKVILGRYKHTVVRIPVLIRIGEFASWLQYNPTKTLIHYIGEHTWFSKRYCQNGCGSVLKELIYRGHALILLDGLDEIPEVRRREEIVRLIEEFIREYVKDPNSISAFDEKLFDNFRPRTHVVETQPPSKSVGNQIIITSRIVGYDMNSLIGTFITHCLLPLMKQDQVNEFAEKWMSQVEQVVHKVLSSVENNIGKQIIERLSQRRIEAVKSIFENGEKCLLFNPSLLTLICASTYQSLNEFRPKSRIEILHHVVESALRFWTKQEPSISKQLLREFLINLSSYLQLKSPSGLIDTFDITRVAHLTLKQRIVTITGAELRQYTKKLLKTLESNAGIVAERGLNVFAFQHLSFQEYFVAQSLVKCDFSDQKITKYYEIEKTANRILSFTINPCFREPLLMALGWISCKWPFDYFDRFCTVLIRSNENYSIPLGALLLFDALNDMQSLPSESVIFTALSCLLDHPSNMIAERYLIPSLFKLSEDIIRKWMSSQFKDDKSLSKFCQCLLMQYDYRFKSRLPGGKYRTSKFSVISKQLDSFYNEGTSAKFVADQTLRTIMMLEGASYNIFFNPWASYFKQKKIDVSTIHPLILPILIVVCGGVIWEPDYGSIKIYWSHRRMYHETSITEPIIEYLTNQKQSHSIKVQTIIEQYETVIKKASPSDTSNDIVDTFVALICLHGDSNQFIIRKYPKYRALSMAFEKIKQAYFFITRMFYERYYDERRWVETLFRNTVGLFIEMFYSHSHQDNQQHSDYSTIYNVALKKLFIQWSVESFSSESSDGDNDDHLEFQPNFSHLHEQRKLNLIEENLQPMQEDFQYDLSPQWTFVPLFLKKFYHCLFINPNDKTDSLPFVVFLAQYLTYLENVSKTHPNFAFVLTNIKSICEEHMLENYLSVLLFKINSKNENKEDPSKESPKPTDEVTLLESNYINLCNNWEKLIDMECQRISDVNNIKQNENKDCRLFAASICLARLSQVQYYSPSYDSTTSNTHFSSLGEKVSNAIRNICDPILQIIALDMILEMKDPFIFDEKQRNELDLRMTPLLKDFLPFLPLLTLTFMVVRFHTQQKDFPISLMIKMIGKRLRETLIDRDSPSREAVLIVLKELGHSDDLPKSFDPTEWNLSLLFRCFTNGTSFGSLNTTFLSLIYMTELAFDTHLLQMYIDGDYKDKIFYLERLISQGNDSSNNDKIMTYEAAKWITNYLQKPQNKDVLHEVITIMFECLTVEEKALAVIEQWIVYRNEKNLRIFAQYAALQLFIERSNLSHLIDIINEIFSNDDGLHFNSLIEHIVNSRVDDYTILRQILTRCQTNLCYSSHISIWLSNEKIFDSILNLELERVTQNEDKPSRLPLKSLLFIINGCSYDLQVKLKQHLQTFIEQIGEKDNIVEEQYVANVIKWIIE